MPLRTPIQKKTGFAITICLCVESSFFLAIVELAMLLGGSARLKKMISAYNMFSRSSRRAYPNEALSHAMDLACVFYFKRVLCLQRSAATTLLMRRHGIAAQMFTGAQIIPPEFHAWVEVDGLVVNDKPYMRDIYQILECW